MVKLDEIHSRPEPSEKICDDEQEEAEIEQEHEAWNAWPAGGGARLAYVLVIGVKAMIHFTVPDVHEKRWRRGSWYLLTLLLSRKYRRY